MPEALDRLAKEMMETAENTQPNGQKRHRHWISGNFECAPTWCQMYCFDVPFLVPARPG